MGGIRKLIISRSEDETLSIGEAFGRTLSPNSIVCFFGDLGAGKTTFIKGIASGRGYPLDLVNSPTYVYLNIYKATIPLYHFDLYRLRDCDEFLSMGFDELLFGGGISCIEWSERISPILPGHTIRVNMSHQNEGIRKIEIIS